MSRHVTYGPLPLGEEGEGFAGLVNFIISSQHNGFLSGYFSEAVSYVRWHPVRYHLPVLQL